MNLDKLSKKLRALAECSNHRQHRMACAIFKKKKPVSFGWNMVKSHTKSIASYNMLHAEISALLGIDYYTTKGCVAYVYRENRQGEPAMAKPCGGCELALKLAGIKKVFYSSNKGWQEMEI